MSQISKLMSLILRHDPTKAGLTLEEGGWVLIDDLLVGLGRLGHPVSREKLRDIVNTSEKKRFTLSSDGVRIRAAQGHSAFVDLGLQPREPPAILFHGTAARVVEIILAEGLKPMSRNHVHLSLDQDTARAVGMRHGRPVILEISSGSMYSEGKNFYLADNGIWLTERVEPRFLRLLKEGNI